MPAFPKIADGWTSNAEGFDLAQKVPFHKLSITSPKDLGKVVLVHRWWSPPSCAIRCILNYYNIPQDRIIMDMPGKSAVSASSYKKVPQLIINPTDGGYQINDCWVIIKNLHPILTGTSLEQELGNDEAIKDVLEKVPLALVCDLVARKGGANIFARHFAGSEGRNPILKLIVSGLVGSRLKKQREADPASFSDKMKWFLRQVAARNSSSSSSSVFWSCSAEPGPVDLCIFAYIRVIASMCAVDPEDEQCGWVATALEEAGAKAWYRAVGEAYSGRATEEILPEEARRAVSKSVYGCW